MGTIALEGNSVWLERHQEVDNRVIADYQWYDELAVVDYPLEHEQQGRMVTILSSTGNVCCIDPSCLVVVTILLFMA